MNSTRELILSETARRANDSARAGWSDISVEVRQRLAGYGIHGPRDWRALSADQRGQLWGVTTPMVITIDAIVRAAL